MTVYYVDPSAKAAGNGTLQDPYNSWAQINWVPGATYLQEDGTIYSNTIYVLGSNVTISSYGSGAPPQIEGVYFSNASNDSLSNFTIKGNSIADVVFANGASNDIASNSDISFGNVGVLFASGAGVNDTVSTNNIHDNLYFGIDAAEGTSSESVLNNSIYNNGSHAVELEGNAINVSFNNIYNNSISIPGSSGIHTYTPSSSAGGGDNNVISYNLISGTQDNGYGDGNGIELDQWTHGNLVLGNILYDNDGAGIVTYGSYNNQLVANVSFSNQLGLFVDHGIHGEFDFISGSSGNDLTYGNSLSMNILDATSKNAVDMFFDSNSSNSQTLGTNFLGGSSGALSSSQFVGAVSNWYNWWSSQNIPSTLLTAGHAALEGLVSF